MKVYTNANNPHTLKILASSVIAGQDVSINVVDVNDKRFQCPRRLPVLELESGNVIFSSNVASSFILRPTKELENSVTQWLTWDTVKLQPLIPFIATKTEPVEKLESLLIELDRALDKKDFLLGNQLTTADICILFTLYPIFKDAELNYKFIIKHQNLVKWSKKLFETKPIKDVSQQFKISSGSEALVSVRNSCWYPSPDRINLPNLDSDEEPEEKLSQEHILQATIAWEKGSKVKLEVTSRPVLPLKNKKNILVTSALPYVNNVPHLGNIIGCVLSADVFARYSRFRGWNTLYVSGTDEYGTATETKALEEGVSPQEICDKYFAIHDDVYKWFNISFDYFGRTTTLEQKEVVQTLFNSCHKNGFTSISAVDQLLCEKCERYLADRFVEGICPDCKYEDARGDQCDGCGHLINAVELINPRCKVCQNTPIVKQSNQLFLELPKLEERLSKWVDETSDAWSHNAQVITKAWIKGGLKPRCITRDLKWGIPVPLEGFEQKVFYVWFDAPIGYMSMTKRYTNQWLKWWRPNPNEKVTLYQFMAKDNVPFHSIMFPATLMASNGNYTILNHLMATEYLNYENGKFSKSRGIGVFGNDAKDTGIPSDIFRFYLLYIRPESQDTNFSWNDLAMKNNTELLNNLGNFIMRSLSFVEKFYSSTVPEVKLGLEEKELLGNISIELKGYLRSLDKCKFRDGIKYILNISRHGNQYMQNLKPWVLIKGSDSEKEKSATVVALLSNVVCLLASTLQPFMPQTVQTISEQVNLPIKDFTISDTFQAYLQTGHIIGKVSPLFAKIEQATVDALKAKYAGKQVSPVSSISVSSEKDRSKAIAAMEDAVAKQGEIVRNMKSSGKSKDEIKTMVDVLLDLKKQLASLKEAVGTQSSGDATLQNLEEAVAQQGNVVRSMKSAGKSKDELKPMIDKLLELKKQLEKVKISETKNEAVKPSSSSDVKSASDLEEAIKKQGELVRSLKASKDERAKEEIAKLLNLKKQLAELQGAPVEEAKSNGSSKKKNKKK